MSDSPPPGRSDTLSKMDALLKKHRGGVEGNHGGTPSATPAASEQAVPPDAWLPVLTQVIERGMPPAAAVPAPPPTATAPEPASPPAQAAAPAAEPPPQP